MLKFLTKLFDENTKILQRYQPIVTAINKLEPTFEALSEKELTQKTEEFRSRISKGEHLDGLLPEAFAATREAARRTLGMRHYDVQLLAGLAFHEGKIAEQKTGEGKTLSATLPLYLNSLTGKGVHLVTVNDYLAQLGAGWMGPIFSLLGVRVGVIIHDAAYIYDASYKGEDRGDDRLEHFRPVSRKEAYEADITYGTNNEFGFDYLRDNMAQDLEQMVQRGHSFAIVDEADSILIDEARTPLIISAPDSEPTSKYYQFSKLVEGLESSSDYIIDEKLKSATLTDLGVKRIERKLGVKNLYEESFDTIHHVEQALRAKTLFKRDKEYIVREDQVIIVDEHTGRLMYGRRYSDGLHQAIEAKEGVKIQQESRTLATVSLQNYFRLYGKLAGMSGTASTETEEFHKIYKIGVLPIPTHVPVQRQDLPDVIYKTTRAKFSAIVQDVAEVAKTGQPVLIGTRSIEHNEIVSQYLTRKGVKHQVLNAKNHEREAFIIADAGRAGAVTVATNIAGRGVDIVLGGSKPERKDYDSESAFEKAQLHWKKAHEQVLESGGLYVIGTERHESRRIDNQLRGRSGRQGDPGKSRFYVSLDDEIMRIFGGDKISNVMTFLKLEEDQPIEHAMISRAIEQAQIKVEGFFFDQRKRLVEFDDVMNKQREVVYARRRRILEGKRDLHAEIALNLQNSIAQLVTLRAPDQITDAELDAILKDFLSIIPFDEHSQREIKKRLQASKNPEDIITALQMIADETYSKRTHDLGLETVQHIERFVALNTQDEHWMNHLDNMDSLREGIWLRGDKNAVLSAYKQEAFQMFETLMSKIDEAIIHRVFRIQPQTIARRPRPIQTVEIKQEAFAESLAEEAQQAQAVVQAPVATKGNVSDLARALAGAKAVKQAKPGIAKDKVGRNDLCPCGSGKKYKHCHYPQFG